MAMDGLPYYISHALYVGEKGQTSLGRNPHTWIPSIQAIDHIKDVDQAFPGSANHHQVIPMDVWVVI